MDPEGLRRAGLAIDQGSQGGAPTASCPPHRPRCRPPHPGSRLEIIPGGGHTSSVEEPEAVNRCCSRSSPMRRFFRAALTWYEHARCSQLRLDLMGNMSPLPLLPLVCISCAAVVPKAPSEWVGPGGIPFVCRLPDCAIPREEVRPGVFMATYVARYSDDQISRKYCPIPAAPNDTVKVAEFHNHPTRESFSADIDIHESVVLPQYLLAPSGAIYRYTPASGAVERWQGDRWVST